MAPIRFLDSEHIIKWLKLYKEDQPENEPFKFKYEAKEILEDIKLISINEIYSSSDPGKKLHSVLSGPYANRSAANNSKEVITKKGFEPRLRTLCKEK